MNALKVPVALLACTLLSGEVASAAPVHHANTWSGYVDTGATFTSITARWIQPAVECTVPNAQASFWIGFDGFGNGTVEQVGTIAKCSGPNEPVVYRAWWEMVASTGNRGGEDIPVSPGDCIVASVRYAAGAYQLAVRDLTSGRAINTTKTCTVVCLRNTAEWIVERPGSGKYPLAKYVTVGFKGATLAAHGPGKGIAAFPHVRLFMVHAGTTLSTPSRLAQDGSETSFHCTWRAAE